MRIAVFGAGGNIGRRVVQEALARGHDVTAVVREPARLTERQPGLRVVRGDVTQPAEVAAAAGGQDAVVSAVGPSDDQGDPQMLVDAAKSLLDGMKRASVKRLIVVGGAGSLEVAPGVQLMDTPGFPAAWKPLAQAHRDALAVCRRNTDLDWTYVSPAGMIEPGERRGDYRIGGDQLVLDAEGRSFISMEDFAVALVDEVECPAHIRQRFTVAY